VAGGKIEAIVVVIIVLTIFASRSLSISGLEVHRLKQIKILQARLWICDRSWVVERLFSLPDAFFFERQRRKFVDK
jgi:hypothetical protein